MKPNEKVCTIPNCPCYKFEYDICDEMRCNRVYCRQEKGYDCKGKYWEEKCIFHGEHIELNLDPKIVNKK